MPQAPDHLREMFEDDGEAWELLEGFGWKQHKSLMYHPAGAAITEVERDAANYLVLEWDWSWEGPQNAT